MIYTIGGIKGGSGKTTVAVSLAVMLAGKKRKVLLVDADKQATATEFTQWRTETLGHTGFVSIQLSDMRVRNEVMKLKSDYDDIVIDAGGRDTASQRAALAVSDIFIAPFAPKSFDIWTLEQVVQLVQEMQIANPDIQLYALLNKVDYNEKDIRDARAYIEESDVLKVLKATLHERKAFANAAAAGLAVTEHKPINEKAAAELKALFKEILALSPKVGQGVELK
jgi:chromosome partitioning protein